MEETDEFLFIINLVVVCYAAVVLTLNVTSKQRRKQRKRSLWVREMLRKRNEEGAHSILIPKLLSDDIHYRNFFRMSKENFSFILAMVEPALIRRDTVMRASIKVSERLALTLRYLATGTINLVVEAF